MREIKFRGYSKEKRNWYYGLLSKEYKEEEEDYYYIDYEFGSPRVEEASIGQYTGFKDKNGKEIYEGDIVRYETYDEMDTYINKATVYFDDEFGMWKAEVEREREIIGDIQLSLLNGICIEVVGNTYEEKLDESLCDSCENDCYDESMIVDACSRYIKKDLKRGKEYGKV